MTLPAGWPAESAVETLPTVYLSLPGSPWPPAGPRTPLGVAAVVSWSVERELVGSVLPGNVRARSGLSIGVASATIAQVPGMPLAPWSSDLSRRVATAGPADLYAAHGGHDSTVRVDLGDWIVDPALGSLVTPSVGVDLIERQYEGRKPHALPIVWDLFGAADPIWIVDQLARQVGYYSTPQPVASTLFSVPLVGGVHSERPNFSVVPLDASAAAEFSAATGSIGVVDPGFGVLQTVDGTPVSDAFASGSSLFFTLNYVGTVLLIDPQQQWAIELRPAGEFAVTNYYYGVTPAWVTGSFTPGLSATWPHRVALEVQRTGNRVSDGFTWSEFRVRARSAPDAAWSSWVTSSTVTPAETASFEGTYVLAGDVYTPGGTVSAFQVTSADDLLLWVPPNAEMVLLGGALEAPHIPADMDVWAGIQDVCAANVAAAHITRDRVLRVLDRNMLSGVGVLVETLDVGRRVEDLGWTIDPADTADRLEVTYSPPALLARTSDPTLWAPIVWQADQVVDVPPGGTRVVRADLDRFVSGLRTDWLGAWYTEGSSPVFAFRSTYSVFTNPAGTGTHSDDDAVTFGVEVVSASRVNISIHNPTAVTQYLVDAAGQPCLILRAHRVGTFDTTALVERGAAADDAANPLSIDLGRYVQTTEAAEAVADYIWARVSTPMWRASSVRVKVDWDRDIGDILLLTHERSGLSVKALVTKVAMQGEPGEVSQELDLVLLPPTWADFDSVWAAETWADFDTVWAAETWADFDSEPMRST